VATLVLSPEDLLLHLAIHLMTHLSQAGGFRGHVRTLCDIGETCRRYRNAIDWRRLVTQAEAYNLAKQLYYALRLACDLVGAGVPSSALTDLRASFGPLPIEDRFLAAVAREAILSDHRAADPRSTFHRLGAHLLVTRRARDGAMLAGRLLAHSGRVGLRRLGVGLAGSTHPQTAQCRRLLDTPGEVAVTYDREGASDGVAAHEELQRNYALYALSRALGTKYVHTPLGRVGYQGLLPLFTGRTDPDFVARHSAFYSLPSDAFDLEGCERVPIHNLDLATVERYRERAAATGRPILLQAVLPFAYTDEHPAAYRALRGVSPYWEYRRAGPVRVCIDLHRGGDLPDERDRWLPNSYYVRICGQVLEILRQQGVPFVVRLHTELPPRPDTSHPGTPGLYFAPEPRVTLDPAQHALEEFEALPNLEMVLNAEPREALDDFATADVLILSASSFGYLGGLLNPHGLVVFAPSTRNAPLPDWLVADEHGDLDPAEVATRVRALLARRSEALDGVTTLRVCHGIGLTSCLGVRLQEVSRCRASHGHYPDDVDSSGQFQWYTDNAPQNVAELLLAPVRPMKDGPYIYFHTYHQFAWYRDLDLQALHRLARSYCWPSKSVVNEALAVMRSMQGRTAVLYRGNDKIRETPRTPYEMMFEMAEHSKSGQFWIQTDEADFFDAFKARFPDTRRIEELPMIRRNDRAYVLPKTGRAEFAVKFLAALYAIAHAPQIICTTGNTALWPVIFRGHTRGVWQYYSRYDTYVGGEDPTW
jgi:hypothetical protein